MPQLCCILPSLCHRPAARRTHPAFALVLFGGVAWRNSILCASGVEGDPQHAAQSQT